MMRRYSKRKHHGKTQEYPIIVSEDECESEGNLQARHRVEKKTKQTSKVLQTVSPAPKKTEAIKEYTSVGKDVEPLAEELPERNKLAKGYTIRYEDPHRRGIYKQATISRVAKHEKQPAPPMPCWNASRSNVLIKRQ